MKFLLLIPIVLLLLIFIALVIPLRADIGYSEELVLTVKYLFLKFKLFPSENVDNKEEKSEKETDGQSVEKKTPGKLQSAIRAKGFRGFIELVSELLKLSGTTAVKLLKRLHMSRFDLYVMTGGEDAAEAAVLYGRTCAVIYPAAELLLNAVKCRKTGVTVDLDYSVKEPYVRLESSVYILPIFAVYYGIKYLFRAIPLLQQMNGSVGNGQKKAESLKGKG